MEKAIQKAIEGGWDKDRGMCEEYFCSEAAWCDPLFWQALGKAMGWDEGEHEDPTFMYAPVDMAMWQWKWHRFIDYLVEGKDAESFFNDLLK